MWSGVAMGCAMVCAASLPWSAVGSLALGEALVVSAGMGSLGAGVVAGIDSALVVAGLVAVAGVLVAGLAAGVLIAALGVVRQPGIVTAWLAVLGCFFGFVLPRLLGGDVALVDVRKAYHGLAVVLFTGPTLVDGEWMVLAYAAAMCMFVVAETVRVLRVEVFGVCVGSWLDGVLDQFIDDRDSGVLVVTHSYLLIGCALPLVVHRTAGAAASDGVEAVVTTLGVVVLGVADAAASFVGTRYGSIKWPGSRLNTTVAVYEAASELIDNLMLPVVALAASHCFLGTL
ncbi:uncharacterized protein AMSG_08824 [Thecamonas trahens ATCC 50062]|uniref:dolichol kinase n=1 Tax=Thecamonas trahens ATCC 50062 TaxID=461836 RepID=A0A0L0DLY5_THETB|nr:hypothetical protein AMSG_08824 [Thecamonas trahens ATCC 50062]KNC53327.1 hypothetical protein AMSG_08824 [Thecamonas trahens ATCC 50062]|eukprot:XP_013754583.1 hypothetical protein AMSG_08824 [Thecamonas trahens ATCC 50062]